MKSKRRLFLCCFAAIMMTFIMAVPTSVSADTTVTDETSLKAAIEKGESVKLGGDIDVTSPIEISAKVTIDMNGYKISNSNDIWNEETNNWSLISVKEGGNLTLTGSGTLDAKENDCYAMDIDGGSCTIENGTIIGNISAVYVYEGNLTVNGGDFSIKQKVTSGDPYRFTLNCYDQNRKDGKASIKVNGGTFDNFNPLDNLAEGSNTDFVQDGDVTVASLNSGSASDSNMKYYLGTPETVAAIIEKEAVKGNDVVVLQGNIDLSNVGEGVNVTNKSDGSVVVNGSEIDKDGTAVTEVPATPATPTTPTDPSASGNEPATSGTTASTVSNAPETSDNSHMGVAFAVMLLAGAAAVGTAAFGKRRKA